MVHHVYREKNGCLVRFSLLPSGAIKKAQVLGGKLRLMSFEWTHLACPKTVYERMVESMDVKLKFGKSEKEMKSLIADQYGPWGESGWIHRGTTTDTIKEMFGPPEKKEEKFHEWKMRYGDYRYLLQAVVKDGQFQFFKNNGWERDGKAIEDTVSWVGEALDEWEDQEEKSPLPDAKLEKFGRVLEQKAPKKGARSGQYRDWIDTAEDFIDAGGDRKLVTKAFMKIHRGTWSEYALLEYLEKDEKGIWFETVLSRLWKSGDNGKALIKTMELGEVGGYANLIGGLKEHSESKSEQLLEKLQAAKSGAADLMILTLLEQWDTGQHEKKIGVHFDQLMKLKKAPEEKVRVLFWHLYRREFEDDDLELEEPEKVISRLKKLRPKLGKEYPEWADAIVEQLKKEE